MSKILFGYVALLELVKSHVVYEVAGSIHRRTFIRSLVKMIIFFKKCAQIKEKKNQIPV